MANAIETLKNLKSYMERRAAEHTANDKPERAATCLRNAERYQQEIDERS